MDKIRYHLQMVISKIPFVKGQAIFKGCLPGEIITLTNFP
jgi:hypothetical protein